MRYGFVGLGNSGQTSGGESEPRRLRCRGQRSEPRCRRHRGGGRRALGGVRTPILAATCDCLITCLPSPAASAAVLEEALPELRRGSTWIEMSTNDFAEIEAIAARARGARH